MPARYSIESSISYCDLCAKVKIKLIMGHVFVYATLEGTRQSEKVRMLADSGATFSTISKEIAERIGVPN
jgi:predicted aspartyl protease